MFHSLNDNLISDAFILSDSMVGSKGGREGKRVRIMKEPLRFHESDGIRLTTLPFRCYDDIGSRERLPPDDRLQRGNPRGKGDGAVEEKIVVALV